MILKVNFSKCAVSYLRLQQRDLPWKGGRLFGSVYVLRIRRRWNVVPAMRQARPHVVRVDGKGNRSSRGRAVYIDSLDSALYRFLFFFSMLSFLVHSRQYNVLIGPSQELEISLAFE